MYTPADQAKIDNMTAAAIAAGVEISDDIANAIEAVALANNGRLTGVAPKGSRELIDAGVLIERAGYSPRNTTIEAA